MDAGDKDYWMRDHLLKNNFFGWDPDMELLTAFWGVFCNRAGVGPYVPGIFHLVFFWHRIGFSFRGIVPEHFSTALPWACNLTQVKHAYLHTRTLGMHLMHDAYYNWLCMHDICAVRGWLDWWLNYETCAEFTFSVCVCFTFHSYNLHLWLLMMISAHLTFW